MGWTELLASKTVTPLAATKAELDNLRSLVARSLNDVAAYFDGCRIKRNASEYDFAGGVSDTDADGLLVAVRKFAIDAEAWIKTHHPHLASQTYWITQLQHDNLV
jgi:hypothetical protein